MYDLNRAESQLYNDQTVIKLLQKYTELWHFKTLRVKNEKLRKIAICLHQINNIRSTPFYSDSKSNLLKNVIMYSKSMLPKEAKQCV